MKSRARSTSNATPAPVQSSTQPFTPPVGLAGFLPTCNVFDVLDVIHEGDIENDDDEPIVQALGANPILDGE